MPKQQSITKPDAPNGSGKPRKAGTTAMPGHLAQASAETVSRKEKPDKRRARSVRSREALVEATLHAIATAGLDATTLSRVSEISGLSRGLVAFHFSSKEQLIAAALGHVEDIYRRSWDSHVRQPDLQPHERLAAAIAHDIDFAADRPDLLALLYAIWGEARGNAIYRENALPWHSRYIAEMAADFEDLLPAGRNRRSEAQRRARIVNATLFGFWLEAHLDPEGYDREDLRQQGACLLRALAPGFTGKLPKFDAV